MVTSKVCQQASVLSKRVTTTHIEFNNNKHSDKERGAEEDRINNREEESGISDTARMGLLVRNSLRRDPRQQNQAPPKPGCVALGRESTG